MIEILKWYSIILVSFGEICAFIKMIIEEEKKDRIGTCIALIFNTPVLIYLILN